MSRIEVTMSLPFHLRLDGSYIVRYEAVCKEKQLSELVGQHVEVTFSLRSAGQIDNSDPEWLARALPADVSIPPSRVRTVIVLKVEAPADLSKESVDTFAIRNCLDIINHVIMSYQATTAEVSNSGFIVPLGTSDMQLLAGILVDEQDIRDRWPSHSFSSIPLSSNEIAEFEGYLASPATLPLSRLFLANAILSLERGQYPLAVVQAATAVELRVTQVVSEKLKAAGWSDQAIKPYRRRTLGQKLEIPNTDPRSLESHFLNVHGFSAVYEQARNNLNRLRNRVVHGGYLARHEETIEGVEIARRFLRIVS